MSAFSVFANFKVFVVVRLFLVRLQEHSSNGKRGGGGGGLGNWDFG